MPTRPRHLLSNTPFSQTEVPISPSHPKKLPKSRMAYDGTTQVPSTSRHYPELPESAAIVIWSIAVLTDKMPHNGVFTANTARVLAIWADFIATLVPKTTIGAFQVSTWLRSCLNMIKEPWLVLESRLICF